MKTLPLFFKKHPSFGYPALLLLSLLILTLLGVSGSSIGIYNDILYGQDAEDTHLTFGDQREIRSDEWMVTTQATIAQKENGFSRFNQNYGNGTDMSVISDVPYIDWSAIFKPQNFSFFIMPLENAFAFKWWFLIISLALAAYFLCLYVIKKKILFAIFVSILTACSPFVFWWYQSGTILSFTYVLLIILVSMTIIDRVPLKLFKKKIDEKHALIGKSLILSYLLVAFALLLYPPFQIPLVIVSSFFLVGYLINNCKGKSKKYVLRLLVPFICAVVAMGVVCGLFVATRMEAISAINNTAYPGERTVESGGYNINYLFASYLQPQLINNDKQTNYYFNQSEESNFVVLPFYFIAPLIYSLIYLYRKKRRLDWVIIGLLASTIVFICHLFIPQSAPLLKFFLLNIVPIERVVIGLGLIAILAIIYIAKLYDKEIVLTRNMKITILIYSSIFFVVTVVSGFHIRELYPDFIVSRKLLITYALFSSTGMALFLLNKKIIGTGILALFSLYTVYQIHPLYIGLGPIYNSELTSSIKSISKPDDTWGVADDIRFENIPQISDRKAVTGVAFYPNVSFWSKFTNPGDQEIYNRYAHIVLDRKITKPVQLVQQDVFVASTSCRHDLANELDFILSTSTLTDTCLRLVKEVSYPKVSFFIYKVEH